MAADTLPDNTALTFKKKYTTTGVSPAVSFTFSTPTITSYTNGEGATTPLTDASKAPALSLDYSAATYTAGEYDATSGLTDVVVSA